MEIMLQIDFLELCLKTGDYGGSVMTHACYLFMNHNGSRHDRSSVPDTL